MHCAHIQFKSNLSVCNNLSALYDYLETTLTVPYSFDDILRAQLVYAVSAFDKLMHDFIRIGMIDIFNGKRAPTAKYLNYSVSLETHAQLSNATVPPKEYWLTMNIMQSHKQLSFQEPAKVADGLSLIWGETHKWQKIANLMNSDENSVKLKLKTIVDRRNNIVHEADIDPYSGTRYPIAKNETNDAIQHISNVADAIYNLIK